MNKLWQWFNKACMYIYECENFVLFLKENKNDKGYAKRNCLKLFENTNTYRVVRV